MCVCVCVCVCVCMHACVCVYACMWVGVGGCVYKPAVVCAPSSAETPRFSSVSIGGISQL